MDKSGGFKFNTRGRWKIVLSEDFPCGRVLVRNVRLMVFWIYHHRVTGHYVVPRFLQTAFPSVSKLVYVCSTSRVKYLFTSSVMCSKNRDKGNLLLVWWIFCSIIRFESCSDYCIISKRLKLAAMNLRQGFARQRWMIVPSEDLRCGRVLVKSLWLLVFWLTHLRVSGQ